MGNEIDFLQLDKHQNFLWIDSILLVDLLRHTQTINQNAGFHKEKKIWWVLFVHVVRLSSKLLRKYSMFCEVWVCMLKVPRITKCKISGVVFWIALIFWKHLELQKSSEFILWFEVFTGLILATYCRRYPYAVAFLWNEMPYSLLKTPKTHAV